MLMNNETLKVELETNALSLGKPFTQRKLDEFILLLESKYSGSGYYNAEINPSISLDSQNRAGIEVTISQGERVKIDSFNIIGASQILEEKLLELFNSSHRLIFFFGVGFWLGCSTWPAESSTYFELQQKGCIPQEKVSFKKLSSSLKTETKSSSN